MISPERSGRRRIGIFGGTFDPPHMGHVNAAHAFLAEMHLDALLVMPAAIPPHKCGAAGTASEIRLLMTRAAFDGLDPQISVSDFEIRCADVSYTYRTLRHFKVAEDADVYFLTGADKFVSVDSWKCPEIIFDSAVIVCAMRDGDPAVYEDVIAKARLYKERYGARTETLKVSPIEISSSEIRRIYREGGDLSALIPPAVLKIMDTHHLYRE